MIKSLNLITKYLYLQNIILFICFYLPDALQWRWHNGICQLPDFPAAMERENPSNYNIPIFPQLRVYRLPSQSTNSFVSIREGHDGYYHM